VRFSDFFVVDVGEPNLSLGDYMVFHELLCWSIPRRRRPVGPCMPSSRVGWQPSRFLTDRTEAERAFQLAERLGSVNAAAQELGTTWPSLRKAFTRHGLGMPARNPEAVWQRAIDAARHRSGRPATPELDLVFVALNGGDLPVRARSGGELAERVRRAEDYAALGARVVELHSESHAAKPTTRAWRSRAAPGAPTAARPTASSAASAARPTAPAAPTEPTNPTNSSRRGGWSPVPADPDRPTSCRLLRVLGFRQGQDRLCPPDVLVVRQLADGLDAKGLPQGVRGALR
jgi:hypothetical protein